MASNDDRDRVRAEFEAAQHPDLPLHRALTRLGSTVTVMQTGAHPDDEHSGLLAALRFGRGIRTIIACSTRGEGGQNAIGPERGAALALLRSREMEEAARVLDADLVWLGHGPDDPVHDFGFSKDGDQTFGRWGEERVLERLVRAYRHDRPDIVIPTFLDVPGQHGHHRAMTRAAIAAVALAADDMAFAEHFADGLRPWQVAKLYLPAWSGGGATYDDETPPPPTTVTLRAASVDPGTGVAYDRIGEWSRWFHATQGMGAWQETPQTEWQLHLLHASSGASIEGDVLDGLPRSLADLAHDQAARELYEPLRTADAAIAEAQAAFPDRQRIVAALTRAAEALTEVQTSAHATIIDRHGHRFQRKRMEVDAALFEAADAIRGVACQPPSIGIGGSAKVDIVFAPGADKLVSEMTLAMPTGVTVAAYSRGRFQVDATSDAWLSPAFHAGWSVLGGNGNAWAELVIRFGGHKAHRRLDFVAPVAIRPSASAKLEPDTVIKLVDDDTPARTSIDVAGPDATPGLSLPEGWSAALAKVDGSFAVTVDSPREPGLTRLAVELDGEPAFTVAESDYPHIGPVALFQPLELAALRLDVALPAGARIGYVGAGADNVGTWMRRLGLDVVDLTTEQLASDLRNCTTIFIGLTAFERRADLAANVDRLHRYVEDGGHLVTLYHRPNQWDANRTPPRFLRIGSPSIRWRVTDPAAKVTVLEPAHTLLTHPNRIGPEDWAGWEKERGLYFAAEWDDAYAPLLSMHDPEEQPLRGALVSGAIGKGRHTHVSLVLHHQLDRLVPGAFRLLANLVQPA